MPIIKLAHYSIRTTDLARSCAFYERVIGLRQGYRPPFPFPGAWLYQDDDESEYGVVHLIGAESASSDALDDYLGERNEGAGDTGAVDHIAFLARDVRATWATLREEGIAWRDRTVPSLGLHQVFIEDPSGITVELNFAAAEVAGLEIPEDHAAAVSKASAS